MEGFKELRLHSGTVPFNPTVKFMNVRQSGHTDPCSKKGPSLGLNVLQ